MMPGLSDRTGREERYMALTKRETDRLENILNNTKGFRDKVARTRNVPDYYRAYLKKVKRRVVEIPVPEQAEPVSCYISEAGNGPQPRPVHINIHGGGFYYGHSEDDDLYCARIAAETEGIVVDIDYALTPMHPFPAAFEQCYAVARWVFQNSGELGVDPEQISMGGQSAGGNLTAAIAIKAVETGDFKLRMQILEYPALDFVTDPVKKSTGHELTEETAERYRAFSVLYTDGDESLTASPYISPAAANDAVAAKLPETLIVTGGKDSLRDEAEAFGLRLVSSGITTTMKRFTRSCHGFTVRMQDEWEASQQFVIDQLKKKRSTQR